MALPVGVTTATCTVGVPVSFTGAANIRANVSVKPSVFLVHAETGTPLVDMLETIDTTDGVAGQFTLPHTDQAGFVDENQNTYTNWFYTVTIQYSNERQVMLPKTKVFQLVAGQTLVDLDKLPSGVPALPYTAPAATVTSVVGLTGSVTGAQIAADPALNATYASYVNLAKNPDTLVAGAVTVDANNLVTSAAVVWPNGIPGTLTITSRDANGGVLGYNITYGSPVTKTFTQPTITRNAAGAATNVPQIVVS